MKDGRALYFRHKDISLASEYPIACEAHGCEWQGLRVGRILNIDDSLDHLSVGGRISWFRRLLHLSPNVLSAQ